MLTSPTLFISQYMPASNHLLCTLDLHKVVCQLRLNKAGKELREGTEEGRVGAGGCEPG